MEIILPLVKYAFLLHDPYVTNRVHPTLRVPFLDRFFPSSLGLVDRTKGSIEYDFEGEEAIRARSGEERYKRRAVGRTRPPENKIDNARRRSPPGAQDAADNNLVVNIS